MTRMTIGKVARQTGVSVETIRFYERKGLIVQPPKSTDSAFRSYPAETINRLRFIRQAQRLGFALQEIAELLALRADPSADCAEVRERAQEKLQDVDRKIDQLAIIRRALQQLISACPGQGAASSHCSILDALEPD